MNVIEAKIRNRRPRTLKAIDMERGREKAPVRFVLWPVTKPRRRLAKAMA